MNDTTTYNEEIEQNRFTSIDDFKECMRWGGETVFIWKGRYYGAYSQLQKTPDSPIQKLICEVNIPNSDATNKWCDTVDEMLDYMVGSDKLRDVITQVTVIDRITKLFICFEK